MSWVAAPYSTATTRLFDGEVVRAASVDLRSPYYEADPVDAAK